MEKRNKSNYIQMGCSMENFKEEIRKMAEITHCQKVKNSDVSFLHALNKNVSETGYLMSDLCRANIMAAHKEKPDVGTLNKNYLDAEMLQENETNLFAIVAEDGNDDSIMAFSEYAMGSLLQYISLSGTSAFEKNNYLHNAFVAECFYEKPKNGSITLVYRQSPDCEDKKVYYVGLSRYRFIPQDKVFIPVLDKLESDTTLGQMHVHSWEVTPELSSIYIEYPEAAADIANAYHLPANVNIMPGLWLQTSDIGRSSLTAYSTITVNGHRIIMEEVIRQHCHRLEELDDYIDEFVTAIDSNLFANIKKLPEQLCKLIAMLIPATDLNSETGRENNYILISDILKETIEKTFKKFNLKKKKIIHEDLMQEIIPSMQYSLYDIAALVMSVPDRLKCDPVTAKTVQKEVAKAPFIAEEVYHSNVKETEDFYLLPA